MTTTRVSAEMLAADVVEFLRFKRAMGQGYRRGEYVLNSSVRFIRSRWGERAAPLDEAVTRWATRIEGRKAITVGNEFGVVHQLCLFRRRRDPRARDCCPSDPIWWIRSSVTCANALKFWPTAAKKIRVLCSSGWTVRHCRCPPHRRRYASRSGVSG